MFGQLFMIKSVESELRRCRKFDKRIDFILPKLGDGTLQCWEANGDLKYYCNTKIDGKRRRVRIDQEWEGADNLIEKLTLKEIFKRAKKIMRGNITALESCLKLFRVYDPLLVRESMSRAYAKSDISISEAFMDGDIDPAAWRKEAYKKNPMCRDKMLCHTSTEEKVRSKSEAMIYEELVSRGVDFRYECELILEVRDARGQVVRTRKVYPDFIVLRGSDRRLIVHEHFGRMDDPEYAVKTMQKIEDYHNAGYVNGSNFVFSWESGDIPFTTIRAAEFIDRYLGPAEK